MTPSSEEPGTAPAEDERIVEIDRLIAAAQGFLAQLHEVQAALETLNPLGEAADGGNEEAARRLEAAMRWLKVAGEAGDVWAQYTLGILYEDKRDEPEERAKALLWFRMAAAQNHAESLFHLAEHFRWAEVVPRDDEEAVRLYRAAVAADPAIFRNLGFPTKWTWSDEDYEAGVSWFAKVAAAGEPWAKEVLDGLIAMREEPLIELDLD